MEELLEILEEINPDYDYETEENLIDGKKLDSLEIVQLIADICDTFDIDIPAKYMENKNFNTAQKMWEMIQEIQEEE